jgi:hypothetical protein
MKQINSIEIKTISGAGSWSGFYEHVTTSLDKVSSLLETTLADLAESTDPALIHRAIGLTHAKTHLTEKLEIANIIHNATTR